MSALEAQNIVQILVERGVVMELIWEHTPMNAMTTMQLQEMDAAVFAR